MHIFARILGTYLLSKIFPIKIIEMDMTYFDIISGLLANMLLQQTNPNESEH